MKIHFAILLSIALLAALLAGCGSSESRSAASYDSGMVEYAAEAPVEMAAEGAAMKNTAADTGSTSLPQNRKWIVTVYLDAETEDLDSAITGIDEHIVSMGGYVEDQRVYNGSNYNSRRYRNASLTVRIPAEKADEFTARVDGIANVVSKEKNLEDITLTYTATESRMNALRTDETRLLELLAEAETMTDMLEIEARLTDVRYELERVTSQLRLYNNQVDFATIHLNLNEVQEYTPVAEPTLWERISGGFKSSIRGVGDGFVDVFVWLIVASPYLAVFAVLAAIAVVIFKKLHRRKKRKQEPKA